MLKGYSPEPSLALHRYLVRPLHRLTTYFPTLDTAA
jgi:hypothetical protein